MLQFEELRLALLEYDEKLKQLREALGLDAMNAEIEELEAKTAEEVPLVEKRYEQLTNGRV